MLKAKDLMTREVTTVTPQTEITEIAKLLIESHFNGVPVVDPEGTLVGIICQSDLIAEQKKLPMPSVLQFWMLSFQFIRPAKPKKKCKRLRQ